MIKLLISAWLTATVAVAQTAPKAAQPAGASSAKPASGSTMSASTKPAAGSGAAAKPGSSTAPTRPLPEHSLATKLKNNTNLNPNYEKEKKATGRGTKREYTPRRTASGTRADTMNQRRKP